MNNPRVHSQAAQNLDVKKGMIRHHQRLEITMSSEAFHHENLTIQQLCDISAVIYIFAFLKSQLLIQNVQPGIWLIDQGTPIALNPSGWWRW